MGEGCGFSQILGCFLARRGSQSSAPHTVVRSGSVLSGPRQDHGRDHVRTLTCTSAFRAAASHGALVQETFSTGDFLLSPLPFSFLHFLPWALLTLAHIPAGRERTAMLF